MQIAVVASYLLGTIVVGAALSTCIRRASDYLVAGRNLGLALTTASLAAVQIGAGVVPDDRKVIELFTNAFKNNLYGRL